MRNIHVQVGNLNVAREERNVHSILAWYCRHLATPFVFFLDSLSVPAFKFEAYSAEIFKVSLDAASLFSITVDSSLQFKSDRLHFSPVLRRLDLQSKFTMGNVTCWNKLPPSVVSVDLIENYKSEKISNFAKAENIYLLPR